jgi:hypothetical protein
MAIEIACQSFTRGAQGQAMSRVLQWLAIMAGLCGLSEGCAVGPTKPCYLYSIRTDHTWIDYEVSSPDGVRQIADWIALHRAQLDNGAEMVPQLEIEPRARLQWRARDGSITEYWLLKWYPIDSRPKAEAAHVENLSTHNLDELRDICIQNGKRSERAIASPRKKPL